MSARNTLASKEARRFFRTLRKEAWARFYVGRNLMVMFDMTYHGKAGFKPSRQHRRHPQGVPHRTYRGHCYA